MTLTSEEMAAVEELRKGDGRYYVAQESAFAPGIARDWPAVVTSTGIPKQGRLVMRMWPGRGPKPESSPPDLNDLGPEAGAKAG